MAAGPDLLVDLVPIKTLESENVETFDSNSQQSTHGEDFSTVQNHRRYSPPEKSSKLNAGKVIAVGLGTLDKNGNTIPVFVKKDDTVLLPEYGGTQVKLGNKEYHIFRDEDILGTPHD